MFDYATKLLSSMTTTTATAIFNSSAANALDAAATAISAATTTAPSPPASAAPDQEREAEEQAPHRNVHLQRVKAFLNRTLTKVIDADFSDFTAPYSQSQSQSLSSSPSSSPLPASLAPSHAGGDRAADAAGALPTVLPLPLPLPTARHIEASTFPAQTVATFVAGSKNRAATIIVYPTVSPESIVIPIVSCIFGFPILALLVICCLRRRAKLARERDRRRNYDMQDHAVSLVRFSPIHRLNYRSSRAISLRPERSLSQGFTSLELDTVMEERCSDVEQTQTEIINAESPLESTSYKLSFSS